MNKKSIIYLIDLVENTRWNIVHNTYKGDTWLCLKKNNKNYLDTYFPQLRYRQEDSDLY